ncbi:MAG: hypothetical protein QOI94_39, partial [Acidobacteriaceae bacterium]|nr:hypothetical protein [Acidobacteriaceae bacterium]
RRSVDKDNVTLQDVVGSPEHGNRSLSINRLVDI